jgi:hypothetical protein
MIVPLVIRRHRGTTRYRGWFSRASFFLERAFSSWLLLRGKNSEQLRPLPAQILGFWRFPRRDNSQNTG